MGVVGGAGEARIDADAVGATTARDAAPAALAALLALAPEGGRSVPTAAVLLFEFFRREFLVPLPFEFGPSDVPFFGCFGLEGMVPVAFPFSAFLTRIVRLFVVLIPSFGVVRLPLFWGHVGVPLSILFASRCEGIFVRPRSRRGWRGH